MNISQSHLVHHALLSNSFKQMVGDLRHLKTEIEHLQHLLEKAKVKMQKDFEIWWAEQGALNQVTTITRFHLVSFHAILVFNCTATITGKAGMENSSCHSFVRFFVPAWQQSEAAKRAGTRARLNSINIWIKARL